MALVATSLAAGTQILLAVVLALILTLVRAGTGVHYGNGAGSKRDLTHLVRAQGNIQEYAPLIILAILLTEYNELLSTSSLATLAVAIFFLRLAHGLQLALPTTIPLPFRAVGALSTIGILGYLGFVNLTFALNSKQ